MVRNKLLGNKLVEVLVLRDNQGEKGATIRMRMAPGLTDEGRA